MEEFLVSGFIVKKFFNMKLKINKITIDNFSKYGQLISTKDMKFHKINDATTESYYDLVNMEASGDDNRFRVNIFKAKKRIFPLEINMLEKHPLSSQAFIPLQKTSFIVVVAPIEVLPNTKHLEAFFVPEEEGVNFKPNIWHFPLIALEDSNFLTIDKKDSSNNLEIFNFQNNDKILLNYE